MRRPRALTADEDALLTLVAQGKPIKAIAAARRHDAGRGGRRRRAAVSVRLAEGVSSGADGALERLRRLHQAIVEREEQGETLEPPPARRRGRASCCTEGRASASTERLDVTVLMSDIRGYSTIAEHADPSPWPASSTPTGPEMNRAILGEAGTVMQYVGDAVMAVFGAPGPSRRPCRPGPGAALAMHAAPGRGQRAWAEEGLPPFGLGIGLSTGDVAAALLGSARSASSTRSSATP